MHELPPARQRLGQFKKASGENALDQFADVPRRLGVSTGRMEADARPELSERIAPICGQWSPLQNCGSLCFLITTKLATESWPEKPPGSVSP
jgi:hypothetical protein